MTCPETTKAGNACRGRVLPEHGKCIAHLPKEVKESLRFGGAQEGAGRPPRPRAVDLYRDKLEAEVEEWWTVLKGAREAVTTKFHGPAGEQFAEEMEDWPTRLRAFAEAHDRVYGKPKQQTEVSGPQGGPIEHSHMDLGALSSEELEVWRTLVAKAS